MTTTSPSELGPYKPVSDALVLAALGRAQCHASSGEVEGVLWSHLAEHLGFVHAPATTRKLRPQVSRLRATGLIEQQKARGFTFWRLTCDGRKQLAQARKHKGLALPEAPQHRLWRHAQTIAAERIDRLREQVRETLGEANKLLDSEDGGDSDAWFDISRRLLTLCDRLGSATYCLREWTEPDDGHIDTDDSPARNSDPRRNIYWEEDTGLGGP